MKYKVFLMQEHINLMSVNVPEIADAKEGFWINNNKQHTRGSDSEIWVSPSIIKYVQKIENNEDEMLDELKGVDLGAKGC